VLLFRPRPFLSQPVSVFFALASILFWVSSGAAGFGWATSNVLSFLFAPISHQLSRTLAHGRSPPSS
jgi:hypothetical protein